MNVCTFQKDQRNFFLVMSNIKLSVLCFATELGYPFLEEHLMAFFCSSITKPFTSNTRNM
jgi:hypothetical protein